jgi:hypothetical protein
MTATRPGSSRRTPVTTTAVALVMCGTVFSACGSTTGAATVSSASLASHTRHTSTATSKQSNRIALYAAMRTLWAQHMEWTYATVVAFAGSSPALDPTITRLLRNQVDIGDAFATYYGPAAGHRLSDLLQTHIEDAVPVLTAAKAGDTAALDEAVAVWYANAQDIADFLAAANPDWKQAEMRSMMHTHITQTIAYAAAVLVGNYPSAIDDYDAAEAHMAEMADMLSAGIIRQFPQRFSARTAAALASVRS